MRVSERAPLDFTRIPPSEMVARARRYSERMSRRRSVRCFSDEPFPLEILDHAIRAAGSAPSGANQQPWTFVVVTDPALKRRIRDAAELEERRNWEGRMSAEWLSALEPLGVDWQKPHLTEAPALIVVFARSWGRVDRRDGTIGRQKHYFVTESVGIAVGIMISALHLAGLATLTHTPSPMSFLQRVLGRPENERAFVVVPVGYPQPGATVPRLTRRELDEIRVSLP